MARIRRLAALVGAVALSGAFVTGPARADSPEVYSGSAAGTALDLSVLGKQATFGTSSAHVNSAGVAKSKGGGLLTTTVPEADAVLGAHSAVQEADAAQGQTVTKPRACAQPAIALPEFINIGLVCSSAAAANVDHPSANAEGSVAEADVHLESVVKLIEDTAPVELPIGSTLATVLDPLCATVAAACPATTTVNDLVESVLKTQTLDIELGKSTSSVSTGPGTVTSEATAAGAIVKILPLPQVNGLPSTEPVVTITVGDARAKATYDRSTGKATPTVDPALVRIEFNTALTDTIPALADGIVINPFDLLGVNDLIKSLPNEADPVVTVCDDDRAICILEGTPLESRIYLASGSAKVNADGSATAVADAVRLELLMGITEFVGEQSSEAGGVLDSLGVADPGVHLALAHAEAAVGGKQATVTIQKQPNEPPLELPRGEVPLELPRTGGFPVLPAAGAALLSLAVLLRRAVAQATR